MCFQKAPKLQLSHHRWYHIWRKPLQPTFTTNSTVITANETIHWNLSFNLPFNSKKLYEPLLYHLKSQITWNRNEAKNFYNCYYLVHECESFSTNTGKERIGIFCNIMTTCQSTMCGLYIYLFILYKCRQNFSMCKVSALYMFEKSSFLFILLCRCTCDILQSGVNRMWVSVISPAHLCTADWWVYISVLD